MVWVGDRRKVRRAAISGLKDKVLGISRARIRALEDLKDKASAEGECLVGRLIHKVKGFSHLQVLLHKVGKEGRMASWATWRAIASSRWRSCSNSREEAEDVEGEGGEGTTRFGGKGIKQDTKRWRFYWIHGQELDMYSLSF